MTKLRNIRDLQNHLKSMPDFETIEKPSTTGRIKLLNFAKQHSMVIVVAGEIRE